MSRRRDKRQRNNVLQTRANDEERDAIKARADRVGLTVGTLLRQLALSLPLPTRAVRQSRLEIETLVRLSGAMAKAADGRPLSLLNQVAEYLHTGRPVERLLGMLEEALQLAIERERAILELRLPVLQALGKEPMRREPEEMEGPE